VKYVVHSSKRKLKNNYFSSHKLHKQQSTSWSQGILGVKIVIVFYPRFWLCNGYVGSINCTDRARNFTEVLKTELASQELLAVWPSQFVPESLIHGIDSIP
jgi:peroxiredoxin